MSDATLAPMVDPPFWRSGWMVAGLGFLGGITAAASAFGLAGGFSQRSAAPAPAPVPVQQVQQMPVLPPGTDLATLNARETALAGRLDQLDARLRDIDGSARGAAGYATRAERLMLAFTIRRTIERGQALGALEQPLRLRFGDHPEAVGAILAASAQPVTIEDLRLALDTIAPRLVTGADLPLWSRVRNLLSDLVVLREVGVPSPRSGDRLRRARRALDEGNVETALAEVAHMPGAASADSWSGAARRFIAARAGLAEIERAAADLPADPPAPPSATP